MLVLLKDKSDRWFPLSVLLSTSLMFFWVALAWAQEGAAEKKSVQPYLDQLKEDLEEESGSANPQENTGNADESYISKLKKKLEAEDNGGAGQGPAKTGVQDHIDQLREEYPEEYAKPHENGVQPYIESQKSALPPKKQGGAIQALKEGKSDLELRREGDIHQAFGIGFGPSLARTFTADARVGANSFSDVYGASYTPHLAIFYEFQPFHSEWFGNFGLIAMASFEFSSGYGRYPFPLPKPGGVGNFGLVSVNPVQFFNFPITVGLDYRFNLFRILRPYVIVGPTAIGYLEVNGRGSTYQGYSTGVLTSVGVSLLLDWTNPSGTWNLYAEHGIKHYYFTLDYTRLMTLSGDVNFAINGIVAGLTFEY